MLCTLLPFSDNSTLYDPLGQVSVWRVRLKSTQREPVTGTSASSTFPFLLSPAATAYQLTRRFNRMMLLSAAIGATSATLKDSRGQTRGIPVRGAYDAGAIGDGTVIHITGDPASADFLREGAAAAAVRVARARPGATIIAPPDGFSVPAQLRQDNVAMIEVPVLIQGENMFSAQGTTHVRVYNDAAPRIAPKSLMVSDFPERLTENGSLFSVDLERNIPSRFLYFHYNPAGQPERRIVLRAHNSSSAPALVQFISGPAGPGPNEMEVGHDSTERFLVRLAQNEGRLLTIPANSTVNVVQQALPPNSVVSNVLQLRILNGANVHVTLIAQNADEDPSAQPTSALAMTVATMTAPISAQSRASETSSGGSIERAMRHATMPCAPRNHQRGTRMVAPATPKAIATSIGPSSSAAGKPPRASPNAAAAEAIVSQPHIGGALRRRPRTCSLMISF